MIKKAKTRRGTVLIETALVLIWIILISMLLIEYGWFFLKAQQITNAARQGARVGARADATIGDIHAAIDASLASGSPPVTGYSVTIAPDPASLDAGQLFSVTVDLGYDDYGLGVSIVSFLGLRPPDISKEVTMAREGSD